MNPTESLPEEVDRFELGYFDMLETKYSDIDPSELIDEFEMLAGNSDDLSFRIRCYIKIVELAGT